MTEFYLTTDMIASNVGREQLEVITDNLMGRLADLCGPDSEVDDPALSLDLGDSRLSVELLVRAADFAAAVEIADAALRTAVHAAGYGTSGWLVEKRAQRAELIDA